MVLGGNAAKIFISDSLGNNFNTMNKHIVKIRGQPVILTEGGRKTVSRLLFYHS